MRRSLLLWALASMVVGVSSCGAAQEPSAGKTTPSGASTSSPVAEAKVPCTRGTQAVIPTPLDAPRVGSTVALAKLGDKTIAYVADEDERAVDVIDVDTKTSLSSTRLDGTPSQLLVMPDGRVVVAVRDASVLAVLEPTGDLSAPLSRRCKVETALEPVGLALTPDDATLLVTSGWGHAFAAFNAKDLEKQYELTLLREPRAIVVSDDGRTAFVSHAMGAHLTSIDLATTAHAVQVKTLLADDGRRSSFGGLSLGNSSFGVGGFGGTGVRPGCQSFALAKSINPAGRILAPQVFVDPGDRNERPRGYGDQNISTELPGVVVVDEGTGAPITPSLTFARTPFSFSSAKRPECLLPRAAAVDAKRRTLLVTCYGIDAVVGYDAAAANPERAERRRWSVGGGPSGIAMDRAKDRAVVWTQFDRSLNVLSLADADAPDDGNSPALRPTFLVGLGPSKTLTRQIALGRQLFHSVGDARISKDGRGCASCHPDGRDDSLTWATPEGPRRSMLLAGRVSETAPYSWSGTEQSLKEHLTVTFDRLGGKAGLTPEELDALVAYVGGLKPPPVAKNDAPDSKVTRGHEIFMSKEAGCSKCHMGNGTFTDGELHDVQSRTEIDRTAAFNTPSLRFLSETGPFFHDGRYATIGDLLHSVDGKMGHTKQLSQPDMEALEAYLRSL